MDVLKVIDSSPESLWNANDLIACMGFDTNTEVKTEKQIITTMQLALSGLLREGLVDKPQMWLYKSKKKIIANSNEATEETANSVSFSNE